MTNNNRFPASNRGGVQRSTYICDDCGKRTRETGLCESGVGLCRDCYIAAGEENAAHDRATGQEG